MPSLIPMTGSAALPMSFGRVSSERSSSADETEYVVKSEAANVESDITMTIKTIFTSSDTTSRRTATFEF